MSEVAIDDTDATFAEDVLERSKTVPVVVDLWAPWCGPCRALGPILERVAAEANGTFDLVKINVDENPQVATELGARSIPLVIAFKDGAQVSSFVGAQPEGAVRQFVAELVPSEADLMVEDARAAMVADRLGDAETILRAVLVDDDRHQGARLLLAEVLGVAERTDEALEVLAKADPAPAVDQLRSALRLKSVGDEDLDELRARAGEGDPDAAESLAHALVAAGSHEEALEVLLQAVSARKDGTAKQAMLDVFNVLGNENPLVRQYRGKLARVLF